jgi:hypothetical protein
VESIFVFTSSIKETLAYSYHTLTKASAAVYYMMSYATKHDVNQYQLTILKRALKDAKPAIEPP